MKIVVGEHDSDSLDLTVFFVFLFFSFYFYFFLLAVDQGFLHHVTGCGEILNVFTADNRFHSRWGEGGMEG